MDLTTWAFLIWKLIVTWSVGFYFSPYTSIKLFLDQTYYRFWPYHLYRFPRIFIFPLVTAFLISFYSWGSIFFGYLFLFITAFQGPVYINVCPALATIGPSPAYVDPGSFRICARQKAVRIISSVIQVVVLCKQTHCHPWGLKERLLFGANSYSNRAAFQLTRNHDQCFVITPLNFVYKPQLNIID